MRPRHNPEGGPQTACMNHSGTKGQMMQIHVGKCKSMSQVERACLQCHKLVLSIPLPCVSKATFRAPPTLQVVDISVPACSESQFLVNKRSSSWQHNLSCSYFVRQKMHFCQQAFPCQRRYSMTNLYSPLAALGCTQPMRELPSQ